MTHPEKAVELFYTGYNCAQSVLLAFSDMTGFDESTSLRLASSLGAGIGGAREVCGAVNVAAMVYGLVRGYEIPNDVKVKRAHYAKVTELLDAFRADYETVICRELLKGIKLSGVASGRTPEYYKTRPCVKFIRRVSEILDDMLGK